jgi:lipopolysaccharide export LptBFGC system permease protein LptF
MTLAWLYFVKQYTKYLGITFLFAVSLIFVLDLAEVIRGGSNGIILFTLIKSCKNITQLMPLIVLIGTIITFSALSRRNELVIFTTLGLSNSFFLRILTIVVIIVFLVLIVVFIPFSTFLNSNYRQSQITFQGQEIIFKTSGNLFIRTNAIHSNEKDKVTVLVLDNDFALKEVVTADSAHIEDNLLTLRDATVESKLHQRKLELVAITLDTTLEQIASSLLQPEQISLLTIPDFISNLKKLGFSTTQYERYFYDKISLWINLLTMALLGFASSFSLVGRLAKNERIFYGIAGGLAIFFTQDLIVTMLPFEIGTAVIVAKIIIIIAVGGIYRQYKPQSS